MLTILRVAALAWGDAVIDGAFFIVQTYLTQVWKLNFTTAATFLNIWGGIYRVLPLLFLFLADTLLGNFWMLALSGISSTMRDWVQGLIIITLATTPWLGNSTSMGPCEEKDAACGGHIEMTLFLTGMALVAMGRAARFASTEAFIKDQNGDHGSNPQKSWLVISGIAFFVTPFLGIFAFPYVKKWYFLFGASTICTTSATLFYLVGYHTYKKPGMRVEGSPITDILRVFVVAVFIKRSQPFPKDDEGKLYVVRDEQFQKLSRSFFLGFLHKAAIIMDGDDRNVGSREVKKRSWKVCSVSEVESTKMVIRCVSMWGCYFMVGVVSSIGNTYLVEQMSHMKSNIGSWNAPLQVVLLIFIIFKYSLVAMTTTIKLKYYEEGANPMNDLEGVSIAFTTICCAVTAAVERNRIHAVRRHHLPDDQTEAQMSTFWLMFPFAFLTIIDIFFEFELSRLHERTPESMKRYRDCLSEGVIGYGYMCGALSVYVVGKVSEMGGGKGWFQDTLNKSRLDRYYWVLTTLAALNAGFTRFAIFACKREESDVVGNNFDEEADIDFEQETALEVFGIKKSSALGLIMRHFPNIFNNFAVSVLARLRDIRRNPGGLAECGTAHALNLLFPQIRSLWRAHALNLLFPQIRSLWRAHH